MCSWNCSTNINNRDWLERTELLVQKEGLEKLKEKHTMIREIRGKGLMIGIEMKFEVKDILMGLIEEGVLMLYSGRNILRILPPLVIKEEDVTKVLHALDVVIDKEEKKRNVQR